MTSPTKPRIRRATEVDIPRLVALQRSVRLEGLAWFQDLAIDDGGIRDLFAAAARYEDSVILVAESTSEIAGELDCIGLGAGTSEFVITVGHGHRRRGVGSALLDVLIDWASEQPHLARLEAKAVDENLGSRRLLERFGFSKVPRQGYFVTIRAVRMQEHLYRRVFDRHY